MRKRDAVDEGKRPLRPCPLTEIFSARCSYLILYSQRTSLGKGSTLKKDEQAQEKEIYWKLVSAIDKEIDFVSVELENARDDPKEYSMRIGALFDLSKIYATLKDDFRNDKKAGIV